MEVIYALEPFPTTGHTSLFLAGPTPRSPDVPSWRPEALRLLAAAGYDGHVFVPEPRCGDWQPFYDDQVSWEEEGLNRADVILFWVPRAMATMPGLTTNDEWGVWKSSGKVTFGSPEDAVAVRYQHHYADRYRVEVSKTLESTIQAALRRLSELGCPAERSAGELEVPVHVWRHATFIQWYQNLVLAGNQLVGGRVKYALWSRGQVFLWVYKPRVAFRDGGLTKSSELVVGRPDVSTVVLHGPVDPADLGETQIVTVRENRPAVNNPTGCVVEPPSGSSHSARDPHVTAIEEVYEETGFRLEPARVTVREARQLAATLSAHRSHLFSVQLTEWELNWLRSLEGVPQGVEKDGERTYVEVKKLAELAREPNVDWSALGQILVTVARAGGHL